MKNVLFLFHSNSEYMIEHMQEYILDVICALFSLTLAVPAWFVVYGCMKKAREKKRILVASLVAVLVAVVAEISIAILFGDAIRGFVSGLPLPDPAFFSFLD